jgi:hypothetical protein
VIVVGKVLSSKMRYVAPKHKLSCSEDDMSAQPQNQTQPKIKPSSIVYWLRFGLALVAGFTNDYLNIGVVNFGDLAIFVGIGFGLMFYLLSIFIVKNVLHYGEAELKGKNKYITLGGGTFVVVWIMVIVLLNTLRAG